MNPSVPNNPQPSTFNTQHSPTRVLVTGGAGFIGSHLCERLSAEGRRVVCLDNFNDYYDPAIKRLNLGGLVGRPDFWLREGDIRDADLVEKVFSEDAPDAVVHLAAMAGVRPSIEDPLLYCDVNLKGTNVLLEAVRRHPVGHFVFGSSSSVYGAQSRVPFSEDDPIGRPISPYAATKAAGEAMCHAYSHLFRVPVTCLRFFTVYGPRQRPEMAIHKFARQIHAGQPIAVFGDGSSRRDYTYIDDIVDGVVRALDRPAGYRIYNLGESRTVSLRELVGLLEEALGTKAILGERLPDQPGDVPVTFADVTRARSDLGYQPSTDIETGIKKFVAWYLASL